ncbi:MAG TPA: AMP-binding protein [Pirellulales bacterium]|jgi:long-chain acyl-CoA synthetase|nr:AMP-binding protein [Pirellulales bacterium]
MEQFDTLQSLVSRLSSFRKRRAIVAFTKEDTTVWTYAMLARRASRLAAGLVATGVQKGDAIALWAEPSAQWIAVCLGALACGAVVVPIDAQLDDKALGHVLRDSGARYLFSSARLLARFRRMKRRPRVKAVLLDDRRTARATNWKTFLARSTKVDVTVTADDRAVLFYTSGTTGAPKGVPLTHANLAFQLNTIAEAELVARGDRVLLPLPLHHVYPLVIGLLTPLSLGLPIVLPYTLTGPELTRAVRQGNVTVIIGVPRLYRALLTGIESRVKGAGRLASAVFHVALAVSIALAHVRIRVGKLLFGRLHRQMGPKLRVVATGGAALEPELAWKLEGLGWQVATGYGLTETSPLLTMDKPGHARIGSVGRPIDGVEIRIDPPDGDNQKKSGKRGRHRKASEPPRTDGEIVARGPGVFLGYHHLAEKTKEAFTADGWFRTGDLGYVDRRGYLFITGRVKTLIVLEGGEKVQPDDVEKAYQQQGSAIAEIGILAQKGKLVAVVRAHRGKTSGEKDPDQAAREAIGKALEQRSSGLSSYKRITDFVLTDSPLPRTRLGKIRREELAKLYEQLKAGGHKREPAGAMAEIDMAPEDRALLDEPAARKTWDWLAEHFAGQRITFDTSPQLDLGVDSLEWLNLTTELEQRAGVELSEEAIGRIETVRDLLREAAEQPHGKHTAPKADPLEEPEKVLGRERRRWLAPLGYVESAASLMLYGINWLLTHALFRFSVTGRERVPAEGPFVLAPNHVSYLDSSVLATVLGYHTLRDTYWAGWSGIANGPIFRVLRRLCHVVPIDPERAAAQSLAFGAAVLREKHSMVWYPEGGHSKTGELMPLRPGIGMLLDHYPVPVVPVSVEGTRDALPPGQMLPRPGRIRITFGSPLDPRTLEKKGKGEHPYERITDALHDEMAKLRRSQRTGNEPQRHGDTEDALSRR